MAKKKNTEVQFNYKEWLAALKIGDSVKINNCSHRSCNCVNMKVVGLLEMFNGSAVAVQSGCSILHFCQNTGMELGRRKGEYKHSTLVPFTEADQKKIDEKLEQERQDEEKLKTSEDLASILGDKYLASDLRHHLEASEISDALGVLKKAGYQSTRTNK